MNRRYTALAMTAFAMGTVALTTTEASAMLKDPGGGGMSAWEYVDPAANVPPLPSAAETSSNDDGSDGLRLGAAAAGGASVAFGGTWLYRRRHAQAR